MGAPLGGKRPCSAVTLVGGRWVLAGPGEVCNCEGFRMPAASDDAASCRGRRTKTSKGGNHDLGALVGPLPQLWGFERWAECSDGQATGGVS